MHTHDKKYHTLFLSLSAAALTLWSVQPLADCGKEVLDVNFCTEPLGHQATVPRSPFSIVLHPFQRELAQVVYTDGTTDQWRATGKKGQSIAVFIFDQTAPYELPNVGLPGFTGSLDQYWPDMYVTVTVN